MCVPSIAFCENHTTTNIAVRYVKVEVEEGKGKKVKVEVKTGASSFAVGFLRVLQSYETC